MPSVLIALALQLAAAPPAPIELAALLPESTPIFLEIDDPSLLTGRIRQSPAWKLFDAAVPQRASKALDLAESLKARRLAFAAWPRRKFKDLDWIVLVRVSGAEAAARRIGNALPAVEALDAELLGLASDPKLLERVREVRSGRRKSLASRADFAESGAASDRGAARFHLDAARLLPIRPWFAKEPDPGLLFFFGHLWSAAATAPRVSGTLDLDGGIALDVRAPCDELPEEHAFVVPGGAPSPSLAPPPSCLAHLSMRRDLAAFWRQRDELIPESGKAQLAEFQNYVNILLGGIPIEDLVAALGTDFDLYLARGPKLDPAPAHRLPSAALVAQISDTSLTPELYLAFQTVVGVINATRGNERLPRMLQGSERHRGVLLVQASFLSDLLPEPDDDRRQLVPCMAITGKRIILATHPEIARPLIDALLDGRSAPRPRSDHLTLDGPELRRALDQNRDALAARWVLEEGISSEESRDRTRWMMDLARHIEGFDLSLGVEQATARILLALRAPGLLPMTEEKR